MHDHDVTPSNATRDEQGTTLVELLIVVLVLGIVGSVLTAGLVQGFRTSNLADERIEATTELQSALERTTRELRIACDVSVATANRVVVDLYRNGQLLRYDFGVVGGNFVADVDRVVGVSVTNLRVETLVEDVDSTVPVFRYLGLDQVDLGSTPSIANVRGVDISLTRIALGDTISLSGLAIMRNGGLSCS